MPWSDSETNSYYQAIEVSKTDFEVLKNQDCEYYKDLVHQLLNPEEDRS